MKLTDQLVVNNFPTQDAPRRVGIPTECHRASGAEDKQIGQTARPFPCSMVLT